MSDKADQGFAIEPPSREKGRRPQTINVIVFGETGVGKSAVVNLIAQQVIAGVSSDVNPCTMTSIPYNVSFSSDGPYFRIFDTAGLNVPDLSPKSHLDAIEKAYDLFIKLKDAGGAHLLLFCMRLGHITSTTVNNYRLFVEFSFQKRVPVGVVVTNCENETDVEGWWARNEPGIVNKHGIRSDGHACVTAVTNGTSAENRRYRASQQKVRELLKYFLEEDAFLPDEADWLGMTGKGIKSFTKSETLKKKDVEKVLKRLKLGSESIKRILAIMME